MPPPYVVPIENATPPSRNDGVNFVSAIVEEAPAQAGPWSQRQTFVLDPLDIDPLHPAARDFTLTNAQLEQPAWYRVVWVDGGVPAASFIGDPILFAQQTVTYASVADLRNYAPELDQHSDAECLDALVKAEKDLDDYSGFYTVLESGLKFDPTTADVTTRNQLREATCAQARYRLYMGPVFFIEQRQYSAVTGDIGTSRASKYAPELDSILPLGFRRLTGRFI